jgi:DNA-binding transcriptional LysR family regulator
MNQWQRQDSPTPWAVKGQSLTDNSAVMLTLVRHGVGWTIMPSASFFDDLSQGELAGAPLASDMLQRHLALCLPVTRQTSAATRCVTAILLELTQREVEEGHWPSARWVGQA